MNNKKLTNEMNELSEEKQNKQQSFIENKIYDDNIDSNEDIADLCPDHHYDFHILKWNAKNTKVITTFGRQYNDIPIHSELLNLKVVNEENTKDEKSDDKLSFIAEEEKMNRIRKKNADFVCKFIAYVIAHQCPRNDTSLFELLSIQKKETNEYRNDWQAYFECIQQWVLQMLYKTRLKDEPSECIKQLVIFQYVAKDGNDETDIHPFQLQHEMDKLIDNNKDKETIELLNVLRRTDYTSFVPNKMQQLRKLLNKIQNNALNPNHGTNQLPLFVHYFYPNYMIFSRNVFQIFSQNIMNMEIPDEVISVIIEFAIIVDNSMYYDCWYLQRNVKKCGNKLIELWDNLLFNEKHCVLTGDNKYNGVLNNIWIPSQYLLKNTNNCLQNIANEIRKNNILHIYRQVIWSIFLQINSLNDLYNHDVKHIGDENDWLHGYDHRYFYKTLGWEEWNKIRVYGDKYTSILTSMMYVFGGNIFNSIYGIQRILLVNEYDINAGIIDAGINHIYTEKLNKRMKEIFPIIIPTEFQLIEEVLNKTDEAPFIFEYFINAHFYDPLLKSYLIELMFLDGMDALVLTFAAFITLQYSQLLQLYTLLNSTQDLHEESLKQTRQLFAFKNVKAISKLYIKYKKEIMNKFCDKIQLNNNPFIFPVDYRQNPPNNATYTL